MHHGGYYCEEAEQKLSAQRLWKPTEKERHGLRTCHLFRRPARLPDLICQPLVPGKIRGPHPDRRDLGYLQARGSLCAGISGQTDRDVHPDKRIILDEHEKWDGTVFLRLTRWKDPGWTTDLKLSPSFIGKYNSTEDTAGTGDHIAGGTAEDRGQHSDR